MSHGKKPGHSESPIAIGSQSFPRRLWKLMQSGTGNKLRVSRHGGRCWGCLAGFQKGERSFKQLTGMRTYQYLESPGLSPELELPVPESQLVRGQLKMDLS